MAEPIKMILNSDEEIKALAEDDARELCEGNLSEYVRGLIVFHRLLRKKPTGFASIPGWMLGRYPLQLIDRLTGSIEKYHEITGGMRTFAQKEFYDRVKPKEKEVRINSLALELEIKASTIIDLLPTLGLTEKKTHSSSIPAAIAEKVREVVKTEAMRAALTTKTKEPHQG